MTIITPKFDWAHVASTGELPPGTQLIEDSRPFKILKSRVITESTTGIKAPGLRLTGVFQRADEKNANGRLYPLDILGEAIASMQDAINERRVMGEFDHPPDAKIHMDRVSHLLTKLWMEGNVAYGEMEVIKGMPCGDMLACLIDQGVQVGISSRGVGDMEMTMHEGEEAYCVMPGFSFVTFDAVAEPSVSGTQLMVMESRQKKMLEEQAKSQHSAERNLLVEVRNFLAG
jgi:hypothetical protein